MGQMHGWRLKSQVTELFRPNRNSDVSTPRKPILQQIRGISVYDVLSCDRLSVPNFGHIVTVSAREGHLNKCDNRLLGAGS